MTTRPDTAAADMVLAMVLDDILAGRDPGDAILAGHRHASALPDGARFTATLVCTWLSGVQRRGDDVAAAASDGRILLQLLDQDHQAGSPGRNQKEDNA